MSINHFSRDLQETPWWPQQQQQSMNLEATQHSSSLKHQHKVLPNPQQFSSWPSHHNLYQQHHQAWHNSFNSHESPPTMFQTQNRQAFDFNLNQEDFNGQEQEVLDEHDIVNTNQEQEPELEKEPMFEKPLTPSDVGKLNRLVIPKQHAEKYFPLGGGDSGDKGLLLSFEDESGKCWRFRYSYWNSSQSYVLTKGWSRYVKEKRLDAGDIILFERHRTDGQRLFIGWRRRGAAVVQDTHSGGGGGGGGGWNRGLYTGPPHPYPAGHGVTVLHQPDCLHAGSVVQNPAGNSKTLRLFGVNLECQLEESETWTPMSSQGQGHVQQFPLPHNNMDITFSQDVNQMMRNRQG